MTQLPLDIDRVVNEVLAELKRTGATANMPMGATAGLSGSGTPTAKENGELVLSTRLLTLTDISGRLKGIRHVVVGPQTVVTPAARDALRQRNITLTYDSPQTPSAGSALRLVIFAVLTKTDPKLLSGALQNEGVNVQCHTGNCLMAATDQLAAELAQSNTLGVMLTPHTTAAMCLTNRIPGIRAILASAANSVETDINAVGANLLVIDPQDIGFFQVSRIVGEYCRGGIRPCPEIFQKRLM